MKTDEKITFAKIDYPNVNWEAVIWKGIINFDNFPPRKNAKL